MDSTSLLPDLVERLTSTDFVPSSPNAVVSSKDVTLLPPPLLQHLCPSLPPPAHSPQPQAPPLALLPWRRFPRLLPFNSLFHNYVSALVAKANILAVSVDYRLAPEHPIPTAYEDSWAALHWAASHRKYPGPEPWLNEHADFTRVFLGGDKLDLEIVGAALVHPFFWGSQPIGSEAVDPERGVGRSIMATRLPIRDRPRRHTA